MRISLECALSSIQDLETLTSTMCPIEPMVGSHRDLHPTNVMRLRQVDELVLVDWGYRDAGGAFTFTGREDLAMLVQGRLWWTEQNLRMALAPHATGDQRHLSVELLRSLERLRAELFNICDILFDIASSPGEG